MTELLMEWGRAHGTTGVFVLIVVENLGVPWPTPLAIIIAADLIRQGHLTFLQAVLLCTFAHLAGSTVSYAIGCAGDMRLTKRLGSGSKIRQALEWVDRWYASHGDVTVFGARIIGQVRPWASYVAGLGEVKPLPFLVWTGIGSATHTVIALKLAQAGFLVLDTYPQIRMVLTTSIIIVVGGLLIWSAVRYLRDRREQCTTAGE